MGREYDFLTWVSFPSSIKLTSDEDYLVGRWLVFSNIPVTPGSTVRLEIMAKTNNLPVPVTTSDPETFGSFLSSYGSKDGVGYNWLGKNARVPIGGVYGKTDWTKHSTEFILPPEIQLLQGIFLAAKGLTWFDDLQVFQDDVLIYEDKFSNWKLVGAAAGAVIGGVAGGIYKPIGPIASPLLAALGGAGLGYGTGAVMMYRPQHSCPVCGSEVADKPLGEDVLCGSCGFVSTWSR